MPNIEKHVMLRHKRFVQSTSVLCTKHFNRRAIPPRAELRLSTSTEDEEHNWLDSLDGRSVGLKANIVASGGWHHASTAASRMLFPFHAPFDATVVKLLRGHNASIALGQNMDEFGMGSHSQFSSDMPVRSMYSRGGIELSPGGSSGGSAVSVARGECAVAIGTDTGGSVRLPAAYMGIIGFKPSYGRISRWGFIQYANSLDTVGILGQSIPQIRTTFRTLDKYDVQDPTSLPLALRQRIGSARFQGAPKRLRIGIPLEYNISELSPIVRQAYLATLRTLQTAGHALHPVSLPSTRSALSAYYVLAAAEASSNLAKYDGIRYGYRTTGSDASPNAASPPLLYAETRASGFGAEVKRRILLGAYTLSSEAMDNYFIQAQKIRRMVQKDFDQVFASSNPLLDYHSTSGNVNVLFTPTAPTLPPTVQDLKQQSPSESYMNDVFTVPASLAGLPAISVPAPLPGKLRNMMDETDVQSAGMQVIGQFGDDQLVLDAAEVLQDLLEAQ